MPTFSSLSSLEVVISKSIDDDKLAITTLGCRCPISGFISDCSTAKVQNSVFYPFLNLSGEMPAQCLACAADQPAQCLACAADQPAQCLACADQSAQCLACADQSAQCLACADQSAQCLACAADQPAQCLSNARSMLQICLPKCLVYAGLPAKCLACATDLLPNVWWVQQICLPMCRACVADRHTDCLCTLSLGCLSSGICDICCGFWGRSSIAMAWWLRVCYNDDLGCTRTPWNHDKHVLFCGVIKAPFIKFSVIYIFDFPIIRQMLGMTIIFDRCRRQLSCGDTRQI